MSAHKHTYIFVNLRTNCVLTHLRTNCVLTHYAQQAYTIQVEGQSREENSFKVWFGQKSQQRTKANVREGKVTYRKYDKKSI